MCFSRARRFYGFAPFPPVAVQDDLTSPADDKNIQQLSTFRQVSYLGLPSFSEVGLSFSVHFKVDAPLGDMDKHLLGIASCRCHTAFPPSSYLLSFFSPMRPPFFKDFLPDPILLDDG